MEKKTARDSHTNKPVYRLIQEHIMQKIESGELPPGEQIPTEMALAKQFNVSRMTVNKAIVGLSNEQVLTRVAGKGTFVTKEHAEMPLIDVIDFSEEIKMRGHSYHAKVLEQVICTAHDEVALNLGIAYGEQVAHCKLLHCDNNTPVILENRYIVKSIVPDFLQQDFTVITPTAYLLQSTPLHEVEHTVEAIMPSQETSQILTLKQPEPCLKITRRTWSSQSLVSYAKLIAVGNAYHLRSRQTL